MPVDTVGTLAASFDNASDTATTASFAPTDGRLVIAAIATSSDACTAVSLSGGGVTTWTQFATVAHSTGTNQRKIWLFRAYQASYGAAAVVTITATSATSTAWIIFDVATIDTSGTNGSGAIVQTPTNTGTTETTATVTMSAFGDATNNGAFGFVSRRPNAAITQEGGYTEISEQSPTAPGHTLEVEWKTGEDLAITADLTSSTSWGMIGVEIKAAGGAPPEPAPAVEGLRLRMLIGVGL